jgi:hypothetical protein
MASPGSVGGSDAAKAYAMARLAQLGQSNQWPALLTLWDHESGWNPNAVNSIGAMGIPQAYGHGPVFGIGAAYYKQQVDWGLNYIEQVYGGPAAAWAQWRKPDGSGSYASGGIVPGTGTGDTVPAMLTPHEAVLTQAEWKAIKALSAANVAKYLKALADASTALVTKLTTFVQDQQQYRDTLRGTLSQGSTFSDVLGQSGTVGDVKTLLTGKLGDIRKFATKVIALRKQGWPGAIIRDVSDAGVTLGAQYADLLLGASNVDRGDLIGLAKALGGAQLGTANLTTQLTSGTAGLTSPGTRGAG